ncbi:MAG: Na+/H+ antiporter NhaA [Chloroflexota bacterium]
MTSSPAVPIDRVLAPFREFSRSTVAGGILLIAAALLALGWANSPWSAGYTELFATPVTVGIGAFALTKPLVLWINDGLMAIFFLVVGIEIKRELLVGELRGVRRATLPIAAAAGGAILPAIIYLAVAGGDPEGARGWGIPMATDIAFALGVLALAGSRVPLGLRIFLTALAIVDDLIAVLVIAIFYSSGLDVLMLAGAAGVFVLLLLLNRAGARRPLVYGALGIVLWVLVLKSGVHATIAGVLLAMTIPSRARIAPASFVASARAAVGHYADADRETDPGAAIEERHDALWDLERATERAQAPMLRIEHALHPWVSFAIIPIFALANAGVTISPALLAFPPAPIILGIVLGLVVGKQIGITLATWIVVRLGLATLPYGVGWRHIYAAGWLGGIGFTMSLFVADLGLPEGTPLAQAKLGILAASLIAGVVGFVLVRFWATRRT